MADQHEARVEDTSNDPRHKRTSRKMPECTGKGERRRDRSTLFRARDILPPVILGEPYITASQMKMTVLDNEWAYTRVRSQEGKAPCPVVDGLTEPRKE